MREIVALMKKRRTTRARFGLFPPSCTTKDGGARGLFRNKQKGLLLFGFSKAASEVFESQRNGRKRTFTVSFVMI